MSKYLLVANWKMNPQKEEDAKKIISQFKLQSRGLRNVETVFCPPFVFLPAVSKMCSGSISLGAQDIFWKKEGSYTGEVSAMMLNDFGTQYVIVGHSERRALGETDGEVAQKALAALEKRIQPIVCIGERTRDMQGHYLEEIEKQLTVSLSQIPKTKSASIIIAYEPVWAIGGKEAMDTHEMHQMTIFIKKILTKLYSRKDAEKIKILYGGSVTDTNARDMIESGNVDGLLVGRASLETKPFVGIAKNIAYAKRIF